MNGANQNGGANGTSPAPIFRVKFLDLLLGRTAQRKRREEELHAALAALHGLHERIKTIPPPPPPEDRCSLWDINWHEEPTRP